MSERRLNMWGPGAYNDPRNAEVNALIDQHIAYAEGTVGAYLAAKYQAQADCFQRAGDAIAMQSDRIFDWR